MIRRNIAEACKESKICRAIPFQWGGRYDDEPNTSYNLLGRCARFKLDKIFQWEHMGLDRLRVLADSVWFPKQPKSALDKLAEVAE